MFTHRVYAEFENQIEYIKDKEFDEQKGEVMILEYLSKNEFITRREVERLCGFSSTTSKRVLKALRDKEEIILVGESKSSKYTLKN
ncbi:hypothetical protein GTN31_01535 [Macrococcoides canis]|uniref:Uncharacterized protein n=2 Tax=Macrococcoides canis TaxID=1855823 RepID=A0A6G7ENT9_9STAP|nr:hypothetical protein [Macrococcus canis]QHW12395.1 hypothetical protein SD607_00041 [Macrococcus canis]QIH75026.1 hypothetical protein GTN31_01535 [Macrococcus canis]